MPTDWKRKSAVCLLLLTELPDVDFSSRVTSIRNRTKAGTVLSESVLSGDPLFWKIQKIESNLKIDNTVTWIIWCHDQIASSRQDIHMSCCHRACFKNHHANYLANIALYNTASHFVTQALKIEIMQLEYQIGTNLL